MHHWACLPQKSTVQVFCVICTHEGTELTVMTWFQKCPFFLKMLLKQVLTHEKTNLLLKLLKRREIVKRMILNHNEPCYQYQVALLPRKAFYP